MGDRKVCKEFSFKIPVFYARAAGDTPFGRDSQRREATSCQFTRPTDQHAGGVFLQIELLMGNLFSGAARAGYANDAGQFLDRCIEWRHENPRELFRQASLRMSTA